MCVLQAFNNLFIQTELDTFAADPDRIPYRKRRGAAMADDADPVDPQKRRAADHFRRSVIFQFTEGIGEHFCAGHAEGVLQHDLFEPVNRGFCQPFAGFQKDVAGKTIAELSLPQGVLITLIRRGKNLLQPNGKTEIHSGDGLLIMGTHENLRKVQEEYFLED